MSHDDPRALEGALTAAQQRLTEARALTPQLQRRLLRPRLDPRRIGLVVAIGLLGGGAGAGVGAAMTHANRVKQEAVVQRMQKELLETQRLAVAHCRQSYTTVVRELGACPARIDVPDPRPPALPRATPTRCRCEKGDPLCACE